MPGTDAEGTQAMKPERATEECLEALERVHRDYGNIIRKLRKSLAAEVKRAPKRKPKLTLVPVPDPRQLELPLAVSCNRHEDCELADELAAKGGGNYVAHCHGACGECANQRWQK